MKFSQPVPELPVRDVVKAQEYYRDHLGFEIAWHQPEGKIGAVNNGDCAIFFRESEGEFSTAVFWNFVEDVDKTFREFRDMGAEISDEPEDKPWGLRQFTIQDLNGHQFHFFHDL